VNKDDYQPAIYYYWFISIYTDITWAHVTFCRIREQLCDLNNVFSILFYDSIHRFISIKLNTA